MKIFTVAVLLSLASTSCSAISNNVDAEHSNENLLLRRKTLITSGIAHTVAANECPNSYTIDPNTGFPTYTCNAGCECTGATPGYTEKDDVGAAFGSPGCYRCSKKDGETCSSDFECQLDTTCNGGKCGGAATCPSTLGPQGSPMCGEAGCVCNDGVNTLLEDLSRNGQDCFHCSKPMGATCNSKDECPVLEYNAICYDNKCSLACPTGSHFCGTSDCVCPSTNAHNIYQETWAGCFHCVKPDGESCTHFADCLKDSNCINGVCTSDLPDCNIYTGGTYEFGLFWDRDCSGPPCGCSNPAYPTVTTIEFDDNNTPNVPGGGNCGYVCTA